MSQTLTNDELIEQALLALLAKTITVVDSRLKSKDVSPSDVKNALTLLKDNGMTIHSRKPKTPMELGDLTGDLLELPFSGITLEGS